MKILRNTIWMAVGLFGLAAIVAAPAAADQVILDDLIVDGSICAGFDCVNGESFGFDTLRLKENNLRIKFQDTSTSASFPSADWQITANDTSNGGLNKFSIDNITDPGGRTPFTIEAGARTHALYVDDGGRIGIGTNNPVANLHVKTGNTPTLRLEQDGSSGFTAQTWDVAGNEANFFIRDASNGSTLPFRIRPAAPTSALDIAGSGSVGMGTTAPSEELHVRRTDAGPTLALVENANATASFAGYQMKNNQATWNNLLNTLGQYAISLDGSGVNEVLIDDATGNVTIERDLTVNGTIFGTVMSSRSSKTAIEPVDARDVLAKVVALPMAEWNYHTGTPADAERHLGPMAEDFHAAFGLGRDPGSISLVDYSGVALAAIQGLNAELAERDALIGQLQARLEALEAALAEK